MKLFFLKYSILLIALTADIDPAFSNVVYESSNSISTTHSSNTSPSENQFVISIKENYTKSPENCEIVETHSFTNPFLHQLKNKYQSRYNSQLIIYSKRKNSLNSINNRVISMTVNISPLSLKLQI